VSRYAKIIEAVFQRYWKKGKTEFTFERGELEQVCEKLQIQVPKNLGDVIYTFGIARTCQSRSSRRNPQIGAGSFWVTAMHAIASA